MLVPDDFKQVKFFSLPYHIVNPGVRAGCGHGVGMCTGWTSNVVVRHPHTYLAVLFSRSKLITVTSYHSWLSGQYNCVYWLLLWNAIMVVVGTRDCCAGYHPYLCTTIDECRCEVLFSQKTAIRASLRVGTNILCVCAQKIYIHNTGNNTCQPCSTPLAGIYHTCAFRARTLSVTISNSVGELLIILNKEALCVVVVQSVSAQDDVAQTLHRTLNTYRRSAFKRQP